MMSITTAAGLGEERLAAAQQTAVPDRAADDASQDVTATLVGRQDAVGDEERHRPASGRR